MQTLDGRLVYSASDLNNFSECLHLTALDRDVASGRRIRPVRDDATVELLAHKGDEHERRYFEELRVKHGNDLVSFEDRPVATRAGYEAAEAETVAAMARGVHVIYQATFFDGTFLGRADFLRRVERPSTRWAWSYEVVDTKLASSPKPYFLIQLCNYSDHVARIAGSGPEHAYIVLGTGDERQFRVADYAAYYRRLKAAFLAANETQRDAYPFACAHCELCAWDDACAARRDRDDHLSLVAGIRRDQIAKFEDSGITTMAGLAAANEDARPKGMAEPTFASLGQQAAEQHKYRRARAEFGSAEHSYTFRPIADAELTGLKRLPRAAVGDVFFDMEGDPLYRPDRGLEYLFGMYLPGEDTYHPFWGKTPADERYAFEAFVDFVCARRLQYPELHVYHYAAYEVSALKRLMGRFASRENEIDDFLRHGVFIDLYPAVRQAMWISQPSYSIKKVEALYHWRRHTITQGGGDSIVMFENWLASHDAALLEDIRAYNEDDCRSTHALREWLLGVRQELDRTLAESLPWLEPRDVPPLADSAERTELERRLLDGLPAPDSLAELRAADETIRARWLLGNLLQYYRREQKPEWWEFFARTEHPEDLEEFDRKAIGGLTWRSGVAPYKLKPKDRSYVQTYAFPAQEHDLSGNVVNAHTGLGAGTLARVDDLNGTLEIKLSGTIAPTALRALMPCGPVPDKPKRLALEFVAAAYLDGTLEADYPATSELLFARGPRFIGRPPGARVQPDAVTKETVSASIAALDRSALFVQGPPGSGKSTIGAHAVVDLLQAGKRVALAAIGHKALHNLLRKIEEAAEARGFRFSGCHKSSDSTSDSRYEPLATWSMVADAPSSSGYAGCALVSGTTFAWAEEAQRGAFDVVVVDEAGQVSLADALVVSLAGKSVVLLGDPQQLPQVVQGSHPLGTELSILEHLLGDAQTVPATRGLFLDTSYRMHPEIDAFVSEAFYEGRLRASPLNASNRIDAAQLPASGLAYLAVEHEGNARRSTQEAQEIARVVSRLLRGTVTIRDGLPRRLTQRDILVVAPYNMQRATIFELLSEAGCAEIRVGTVDKFQGQEAPVVIFSMATSSGDDAPRGVDFLFNANRFNVAVSRAQALSIVVCSPTLLRYQPKTIDQMRQVNYLCAYVERATLMDSQVRQLSA